MGSRIINQSDQVVETTEDSDIPFFAAAGRTGVFFSVRPDIGAKDALEGASMFLSIAVALGNITDESAQWAIVHLAEASKALVDSVIEKNNTARRGGGQP